MDEQAATIHRTWVQMCVDYGLKEAAAIAIDTDIVLRYERWMKHYREDGNTFNADTLTVQFHIPAVAYGYVKNNEAIQDSLEKPIKAILDGRIMPMEVWNSFDSTVELQDFRVDILLLEYYVKLITVEDGWKDTLRELIANSSGVRNQGLITELMFAREKKEPIMYNGLKFASMSEVRIAQEFEQRKVLFFPLTVGVRAETGQQYKDHREVDFLVCHSGVWGILEVSGAGHNGRFAADAEKDSWFKRSGILCIEHRTAEQCYNNSKKVVDDFLNVLAQYRKV